MEDEEHATLAYSVMETAATGWSLGANRGLASSYVAVGLPGVISPCGLEAFCIRYTRVPAGEESSIGAAGRR